MKLKLSSSVCLVAISIDCKSLDVKEVVLVITVYLLE